MRDETDLIVHDTADGQSRSTGGLERNCRVQDRFDELMREGKHGHYETLFRVVREEVEREREACARWLDDEADRQEAEWKAYLASGNKGPATSFHVIPRGYAARLRERSNAEIRG